MESIAKLKRLAEDIRSALVSHDHFVRCQSILIFSKIIFQLLTDPIWHHQQDFI